MEDHVYRTKCDVLKRAKELIGIPLRNIDRSGRLSTGKGAIGTVIEESWYGYSPNSDSRPDFPEAGVELKVTPYIRGKDHNVKAKERLVCNIINYMEEYDRTFKTSSFWKKCNTMLLMSYEHIDDVPKGDLHIDQAILFSFPEEDLRIIEQDWNKIIEKVRSGRAHEITEGDTLYLAACTKGASAASVRRQPFSDLPAKQRAYSLKATYMTQILRKYVFGNDEDEHIIKDPINLIHTSFESYLIKRLSAYYGETTISLKSKFGIESTAKNVNELILGAMLGIKGKITHTDEFKKAGIVPKTIRVREDGTIKENMSFPPFDFIELSKENEWETSGLYNYLAPTKFLFVIFVENRHGGSVFERVGFWNIPNDDLEEVGRVWKRTVDTIKKGVTLCKTSRGVSNDLPKQTESPIAHVRPHARNGRDRAPLPDGRMMTKQCFWLNNSYVAEQVKKILRTPVDKA